MRNLTVLTRCIIILKKLFIYTVKKININQSTLELNQSSTGWNISWLAGAACALCGVGAGRPRAAQTFHRQLQPPAGF